MLCFPIPFFTFRLPSIQTAFKADIGMALVTVEIRDVFLLSGPARHRIVFRDDIVERLDSLDEAVCDCVGLLWYIRLVGCIHSTVVEVRLLGEEPSAWPRSFLDLGSHASSVAS